MNSVMDRPLLVFLVSFLLMWLASRLGVSLLRRWIHLEPDARKDFATILATTLTLNGLIIGFTFSMAIERYEQRKNYEEAEANAIGTEYVRADLITAASASAGVRTLLQAYLDQRIAFYMARDQAQIAQIMTRTGQLQAQLWAAVSGTAVEQPTAIGGLAISGMNDVLNSEGYTQAAWWNRIPMSAWMLMAAIAVISHVLVGYGAQRTRHSSRSESILLTVLPLVVSISFLLIADIDSPRSGIIRVKPQNLISLAESLRLH